MSNMKTSDIRRETRALVNALNVGTNADFADCQWTLASAAKQLGAIGELECNGVIDPGTGFVRWNEDDQAKADAKRAKQEKRVRDAFERMFDSETLKRIEIEFQCDPRGPAFYVHILGGAQRVATFW